MGRIHGTWMHQKAAMEDHRGAPESSHGFQIDSQFILYLPKDLAWGVLSASEVQRRAMHAYNDPYSLMQKMGVNPDWCLQSMLDMSRFGNVRGSSNIQKGNIHRDLTNCLGNLST